jgi:hypothetical protein
MSLKLALSTGMRTPVHKSGGNGTCVMEHECDGSHAELAHKLSIGIMPPMRELASAPKTPRANTKSMSKLPKAWARPSIWAPETGACESGHGAFQMKELWGCCCCVKQTALSRWTGDNTLIARAFWSVLEARRERTFPQPDLPELHRMESEHLQLSCTAA